MRRWNLRFRATILTSAILLALPSKAPSAECFGACGDINGSGTVTSADIITFLHWIGWTSYGPGQPECCDVDGYTGWNLRDFSWMIDRVFTSGPALICPPDSGTYVPVPNQEVALLYNQVFPPGDTLVRVQLDLVTDSPFTDVSLIVRVLVDGSPASIVPFETTSSNTFEDPHFSAQTVVGNNIHGQGTDVVTGIWSRFTPSNIPPGRYSLAFFDVAVPASPQYRTISIQLFGLSGDSIDFPMMVDSNLVGWAINPVGRIVDPPGDVNLDRLVTSADIIHLVNYTFKSGEPPRPLPVAGDQNCSGNVNSADVISLVNYVFKSGAEPCDIHTACTVNWEEWTCP